MSTINHATIRAAFAAISPDAIGTGYDADGNYNGLDDWDHPSAAEARRITAAMGMEWDFTTWSDAELLAEWYLANPAESGLRM